MEVCYSQALILDTEHAPVKCLHVTIQRTCASLSGAREYDFHVYMYMHSVVIKHGGSEKNVSSSVARYGLSTVSHNENPDRDARMRSNGGDHEAT